MNIDELDFCNRCLVILDTRASVMDWQTKESCTQPANIKVLRGWLEEHIYGLRHTIAIDDRPNAFVPVSTWQGDPVCWVHLVECREREFRRG